LCRFFDCAATTFALITLSGITGVLGPAERIIARLVLGE
jgi:hypothetical protein